MSAQGVFFHLQRIGSALLRTVMRWEMAQFEDLALLVGGLKPSEKWWSSSIGMMTFPIYGENAKNGNQSTNQASNLAIN